MHGGVGLGGLTGARARQVGETTLDLEDRWFCEEWKDLIYKPREARRTLTHTHPHTCRVAFPSPETDDLFC
jgi:hypothetical protein